MAMTDPIADMLSRIRNANSVFHDKVEIPSSKIKVATMAKRKKPQTRGFFYLRTQGLNA